DFAVCPECVIHGYPAAKSSDAREEHSQRVKEIAEPLDGERIGTLKMLAKDIELDFVLGFVERGNNGNVYNTAAVFSKLGEITNIYRKVHCRPFESTWFWGSFTPGKTFSTYTIAQSEVTAGTFICFDRERPESFLSMRHLSAEFIACPLATNTVNINEHTAHSNESLTQAMAACTESFIAVVNHAKRFNGGSFLVGPTGECIHQMDADPGVAIVEVDLTELRELRANSFGWRGYGFARPEIYQQYIPEQIDNKND
ncbi:MAG: carbon-nitrogen hydrolase family protein, partial [Candidatus Latescibacteria bacterium]|nr:carbon-nitrogen hydrolase family protein [Candidatus Latescibacterota bacterium]